MINSKKWQPCKNLVLNWDNNQFVITIIQMQSAKKNKYLVPFRTYKTILKLHYIKYTYIYGTK